MRFVLALLIAVTPLYANISHSFTLTLQKNARFVKNNGTTWTATRDAATAQTTVATPSTVDTLIAYTSFVDAATDTFKIGRSLILGDTINGVSGVRSGLSQYEDSLAVGEGNYARLDSLSIYLLAQNGVYVGGCTGYIYALFSFACTTSPISPAATIANANYNDYLTPGAFPAFVLVDSVKVDTNVIGSGDTATVAFTISNRTILDALDCMIDSTIASVHTFQIALVTCMDKDSVAPVSSSTAYDIKLSFQALDDATNPPIAKMYWTEIEPSLAISSGWRSSWKNAIGTSWKRVWR